MPKQHIIRLARAADAEAIRDLYAPFIQNTSITFEYEVPSVAEMENRIRITLVNHPWLVCEMDDEVVGYAYASPHNTRAAYQWSANFSVYVRPDCQRQGIASRLYTALRDILKLQGFYSGYAGVTLPNEKSERFHQAFGFKPVGVFHRTGYKFGRWHDVKWFELALNDYSKTPQPTRSITEIQLTDRI